jgi:hypothetical protein
MKARISNPFNGRLEIRGDYPATTYYFGRGERGHIGVTVSRPPAQIAGEISRRLLPVVEKTTVKVLQHNVQQQARAAARTALAARIVTLFPDGHPDPIRSGNRELEVLVKLWGEDGSLGG